MTAANRTIVLQNDMGSSARGLRHRFSFACSHATDQTISVPVLVSMLSLLLHLALFSPSQAQTAAPPQGDSRAGMLFEEEPCQHDTSGLHAGLAKLGPGFGYPVDSLATDLQRWSASPFVRVDSIGASVQGRALWRVSIMDDHQSTSPRKRVALHARTHPMEVESSWLTRSCIDFLLSSDEVAGALRAACIFTFVPMYNPDGVELGNARENANGVDLERGWSTSDPEPEVAVLKTLYTQYMGSAAPIDVALNLHSASGKGVRYFVFHHANGTSADFEEYQKTFIRGVRSFWMDGVGPWDTFVSWTSGTPPYYPESWFWLNFREEVMALTYEEVYGNTVLPTYEQSAAALLRGVASWLNVSPPADADPTPAARDFALTSLYPQPAVSGTAVRVSFSVRRASSCRLAVVDLLGRERTVADQGMLAPGVYTASLDTRALAGGYYRLMLSSGTDVQSLSFIVLGTR